MSTGVRLACPDCTWDCLMTSEADMPPGVAKKVEGVPYCPNCNIAMRPVASAVAKEPTSIGSLGNRPTLEEVARVCVDLQREAVVLDKKLKDIAERHKDARKELESKLTQLSLAVGRLDRVLSGVEPAEFPLFEGLHVHMPEPHPEAIGQELTYAVDSLTLVDEFGAPGIPLNPSADGVDLSAPDPVLAVHDDDADSEAAPSADDEALPLPTRRHRDRRR